MTISPGCDARKSRMSTRCGDSATAAPPFITTCRSRSSRNSPKRSVSGTTAIQAIVGRLRQRPPAAEGDALRASNAASPSAAFGRREWRSGASDASAGPSGRAKSGWPAPEGDALRASNAASPSAAFGRREWRSGASDASARPPAERSAAGLRRRGTHSVRRMRLRRVRPSAEGNGVPARATQVPALQPWEARLASAGGRRTPCVECGFAEPHHVAEWVLFFVHRRGRRGDEPVAATGGGLDVARSPGLVAKGLADVSDGAGQRVFGDVNIAPEALEESVLGDDFSRLRREEVQDVDQVWR